VPNVDVVANGRTVQVPEGSTVADVLTILGLSGRVVVVERNGEPVDRSAVRLVTLGHGDRLEVVRAVAGG
jgi:thiamine biosynthesis protein ThiS